MDALSLLVVAGVVGLGNGLVLWQLNNVKKDLSNRIDGMETCLGNRIDGMATRLDNRIDGGETGLGNRIDSMKADLAAHERECAERNRENAERDRKLHATIGGLIHAVEGKIPHPSA